MFIDKLIISMLLKERTNAEKSKRDFGAFNRLILFLLVFKLRSNRDVNEGYHDGDSRAYIEIFSR